MRWFWTLMFCMLSVVNVYAGDDVPWPYEQSQLDWQQLDGYWMSRSSVRNTMFEIFVDDTSHEKCPHLVTVIELNPETMDPMSEAMGVSCDLAENVDDIYLFNQYGSIQQVLTLMGLKLTNGEDGQIELMYMTLKDYPAGTVLLEDVFFKMTREDFVR